MMLGEIIGRDVIELRDARPMKRIIEARASKRAVHAKALEDLIDNGWVMIGPSTMTRNNVTVKLESDDGLMKIIGSFRAQNGDVHLACRDIWWYDRNEIRDPAAAVADIARLAKFAFLVHAELTRRGIKARFITRFNLVSTIVDAREAHFEQIGRLFVYRSHVAGQIGELGAGNNDHGEIQTDDPSEAADWILRPSD